MNSTILKNTVPKLIDDGWIASRKHPEEDLWVLNYTSEVQYKNCWNKITEMCRGLVIDKNYHIIARPFKKFFNYEMGASYPSDLPYKVYDKLDGSLGILYWIKDKPFITTRGSFESEQAIEATKILHQKYKTKLNEIDKDYTQLFEIIYPQNRVIVDYGNTKDLFFLSEIHTKSGFEDTSVKYKGPFKSVETICESTVLPLDEVIESLLMEEKNWQNKEGYVIVFANGFRLKVKTKSYIKLHRIRYNLSKKTTWEMTKDGTFESSVADVPDEFYKEMKEYNKELTERFNTIKAKCAKNINTVNKLDLKTRKDQAEFILQCKYPGVLFAMLDDKPEPRIDKIIWSLLKPNAEN
jgi:hypothetical protein